jgi:hypothetical protein
MPNLPIGILVDHHRATEGKRDHWNLSSDRVLNFRES